MMAMVHTKGLLHKRIVIPVFWRRNDGCEYGIEGYREKELSIFSISFVIRFNQILGISGSM